MINVKNHQTSYLFESLFPQYYTRNNSLFSALLYFIFIFFLVYREYPTVELLVAWNGFEFNVYFDNTHSVNLVSSYRGTLYGQHVVLACLYVCFNHYEISVFSIKHIKKIKTFHNNFTIQIDDTFPLFYK